MKNGKYRELLAERGLTDFETFWHLDRQWVEEPNRIGTGKWSGVIRVDSENGCDSFYIKQQKNYIRRTWRRPLRGEAWAAREAFNIRELRYQYKFAPVPVLYAERQNAGDLEAVLVVKGLDGYVSLDALQEQERFRSQRAFAGEVIAAVGLRLFEFHRQGYCHGSLYPKHIFIHPLTLDVKLIDFERLKRFRSFRRAAINDLGRLFRRTPWLRADFMREKLLAPYFCGAGPVNALCAGERLRDRDIRACSH
jgi:tRNA A-37 threonylcarbamoyl transferase component Bud32